MASDLSVNGQEPRAYNQTANSTERSEREDLDAKKREVQAEYDRRITDLHKQYEEREQSVEHAGEAAINHIQKTQNERLEETQKANEEAMQRYDKSFQKDYSQLKKRNSENLRSIERENQNLTESEKEQGKESYQAAHDQGEKHLSEIRKNDNQNLAQEREQYKDDADRIYKTSHENMTKEQIAAERKQTEIIRENDKKTKQLVERSGNTNRKVASQYQAENQRLHQDGETEIDNSRKQYAVAIADEKTMEKEELDKQKKQYADEEAKNNQQFIEKSKQEGSLYHKTMTKRQEEYQKSFEKSADAQSQSLRQQRETYLAALYKQNQTMQNKIAIGTAKSSDPFYGTRDINASLEETEGAYVLRAKVPEFERDSIEVRVHKDHIVLQTTRANEAKDDEPMHKSSVSTYQTYREEFALGHPVIAEKIIKQLTADGNLTVTIPKAAERKSLAT